MKIIKSANEQAHITISRDELLILNAALNEVCNGIEIVEFETRIGATRKRAESLLKEFGSLIDEMSARKAGRDK